MASDKSVAETEPFERRSAEARRILSKYPDRIPVICEKAARSSLPEIDKKKFLVPGTMLCGEFKYIIHKHLSQTQEAVITSDQTIYLFVNSNSTSPKTGALMSEVYEQYKGNDGFLYVTYSAENTLGV
uniref:Autophagy-related protein n=1 Tax=Noctiluca scintillans TaxID=2966 RepID=A0A7S1FC25_NOCSC